jgi:hypothetical protein
MAQEGTREPEVKKVHPFFTKGPASEIVVPSTPSTKTASNGSPHDDVETATEIQNGKKRRKTEITCHKTHLARRNNGERARTKDLQLQAT